MDSFYIALFSAFAVLMVIVSPMILNECIVNFLIYNLFWVVVVFNTHLSDVLTARVTDLVVIWLVSRETAAVSVHILCTPCNHAQRQVTSCKATYVGCMRV